MARIWPNGLGRRCLGKKKVKVSKKFCCTYFCTQENKPSTKKKKVQIKFYEQVQEKKFEVLQRTRQITMGGIKARGVITQHQARYHNEREIVPCRFIGSNGYRQGGSNEFSHLFRSFCLHYPTFPCIYPTILLKFLNKPLYPFC